MSKLRLIAILTTIIMLLALIVGVALQSSQLKKVETQLEQTTLNYRALENETFSLKSDNYAYQLTIQDLELCQDSLVNKLNSTRKALNIKESELKEMAYILSTAKRVDTLCFRDTIFLNNVAIDTTITDDWYKLSLGLEYPNKVTVGPEFYSEKNLLVYTRKEILNPSKCWFTNLFKKKTEVVEVIVEEKNPYIVNDKQKFIQIVK